MASLMFRFASSSVSPTRNRVIRGKRRKRRELPRRTPAQYETSLVDYGAVPALPPAVSINPLSNRTCGFRIRLNDDLPGVACVTPRLI